MSDELLHNMGQSNCMCYMWVIGTWPREKTCPWRDYEKRMGEKAIEGRLTCH